MHAHHLAVCLTLCIVVLFNQFKTTSASDELLSNNNILYLNNFVFEFDLLNQENWNQEYLVSNVYNDFNHEAREQMKRSLLLDDDELEQALEELDFNKYYDNNAYLYDYQYYDTDTKLSPMLSGKAKSCSNMIPVIMKRLCVDWNADDGFKFAFSSKQEYDDNELKWYYGENGDDDDIYYNELQLDKQLYFNNDHDWNNVDLVHNEVLNIEDADDLMNAFNSYASSRSVRKCGYYTGMRMCAVLNPHHNRLSVELAVPHSRFVRQQEANERVISQPANFDAKLMEENELNDLYDDEEEEEEYDDGEYDDDYSDYDDYEQYEDYYYGDYYNDMYLDDDFYSYFDDASSSNIDSFDELWSYHYGKYFDKNNVFNAEKFDYGDALGSQMRNNHVMDLKSFNCLNCDASSSSAAIASANEQYSNYDAYDDELQDLLETGYDEYGDYIYYFDDRVFKWDDDNDWNAIYSQNNEMAKCTSSIPGIDHKICLYATQNTNDDKDFNIKLEAASQKDIDDAYYDSYGYDEYYYNMNNEDKDDAAYNDYYNYYQDVDNDEKDRAHIKSSRYSEYSEGSQDGNYYENGESESRLREWEQDEDKEEAEDESEDESNRKLRRLLYNSYQYEDEEYYQDEDYDDYDDEEYYNAIYSEEAEFEEAINSELNSIEMHFKRDGDWDEINRMDSINEIEREYTAFAPYAWSNVYDGNEIKKCKTLQTAQICGTWSAKDGFKVNVRVGAHKHFGLSEEVLEHQYAALVEQFGDVYDDDEEDEEDDEEEKYEDTFFDSMHDSEWFVTNEVTNEFDSEWQDDSQWFDVDQVITSNARALKKKCMNMFGRKLCLCEFVEWVKSGKHVCHPGKKNKQKKKNKKELQEYKRQKKLNRMKQKLIKQEKKRIVMEKRKMNKENKVISKENHVNKKMQNEIRRYKRKVRKLKRKLRKSRKRNHKLHRQPPHNQHRFRFHHPHHHRHYHLHVHHHIPWKMYQQHAHKVPKARPKWLPKWIWRELKENYKDVQGFSAQAMDENEDEFYDYYSYLNDYYGDELYEYDLDDINDDTLQDQWVDEQDGSSWIVSSDIVDNYDTEWDNDEKWDEINTDILTASGNMLTRKCMHMWGHRLCLCQFLDFLDSHKYKCTISTSAFVNTMEADAGPANIPWMHQLPHKPHAAPVKIPKKMMSSYHMKAKVNDNGKKSGAELHVKSTNKMSKSAREEAQFADDWNSYAYDYDYDDNDDIDSIRRLITMTDDLESKMADEWYDSQDSQLWSILNEDENDFNEEWLDDELWDEVTPSILTNSGHSMKRKCMNIFGRKLCLCQFINWIKFGDTKHECGRKQNLINKKEVKKIDKRIKKEKQKVQKTKAVLKEDVKQEKIIKKKITQEEKRMEEVKKPVEVKKIKKIIARKEKAVKNEEKKIDHKEKELKKLKKKIGNDIKKVKPIQVKQVKLKRIPLEQRETLQKMNENTKEETPFKLMMRQRLNSAPNNKNRMRMMRMKMMHRLEDGIPMRRPSWLPHYFWHWLHHGHRHRFHHHPKHWRLWRPKFRKLIRFLKLHDLAHRLQGMQGMPPIQGMPPMQGMPPPPFPLFGLPQLAPRVRGRPPMRMPPLLRHPPPQPFRLNHGPRFMHPIHLQIMLLKHPKLWKKMHNMQARAMNDYVDYYDYNDDYDDNYDAYDDNYGEYDDNYGEYDDNYDDSDYIEDENGDYFFDEQDSDIVLQKPFVANANANVEDEDIEDDNESTLRDEWVDSADGMSWFVSNKVMNDYDEEWENNDEWDQINEEIVTLHGNQITRKCMHMWGQRLCLCQFLNFIDSRKYKCLPSAMSLASGSVTSFIGHNDGSDVAEEYHSYGSPDISHHVTLNHDPEKIKHETIHLMPNQQNKNTKITHQVNYKISSKIKQSKAKYDVFGDQYEDYYYDDDVDESYYFDDISEQQNDYEENYYYDDDDIDEEEKYYYGDDVDDDDVDEKADYFYADVGEEENYYDDIDEEEKYYDDIDEEEKYHDDDINEDENYYYDDDVDDEQQENYYDNNVDEKEDYFYADVSEEENYYFDNNVDENYYDDDVDDNYYDNDDVDEEEDYLYDAENEDNDYNDEVAENEEYYNEENAYENEENYNYNYEKEESDHEFNQYFNGNENMEEQNGDMEPGIFWTANVFAIMCSVVLCFFMGCYFIRKRKKRYQFTAINTKMTDFDEDSTSDYSNNKYGFHPVNISVNQKFSDDDDEEEEEQHDGEQEEECSANESHESDEYDSDREELKSKKQHEMMHNEL